MTYELDKDGYLNDEFQYFILKGMEDEKYRHETYIKSVEHAEEMSVHLYGSLPVKLLNTVRPREDAETKAYRLAVYQPTTESTAEKALTITSSIFNPTLYTIQWPANNENSKKLEEYSMEYYPMYNSVISFLQQVALKKMLADPNGVIAVTIAKYDILDIERAQPTAVIYGSKHIWYQDSNMFLIFKRKEDRQKGGALWHFCLYDRNSIIEFTAEKLNQKKVQIIETARYDHNFDEVPVWHLRGIPEALDNGAVYFKSFFKAALSFWNLAINHESDLMGAYTNHMHPIRAELAEECDYRQEGQRCQRGMLNYPDGRSVSCPGCHGSGYRSVKSPYGVYQYNKEKLATEGSAGLTPVQYITVPTEPTSLLEARIDKLYEKGLNAINMDVLNKIGENQSGRAKVIDRGELYNSLYRISTVMFDIHLANILYFFNKYMFSITDKNREDKNLPEINKPVQFDISTALELIEQLKTAKDAGVNPQFKRELQKKINDKEWASSPDIKAKLDLMIDLDPAPEYELETLIMAVDAGLISKEFAIIHVNIEVLVDRALVDHKDFLDKSKEDKMKILTEYAKEMKKEMEVKLDTSAIETGNTGGQTRQDSESGNQAA